MPPNQELDQEILFVGSGMFGDPAHDRRELIAAGEEYGVRVLSLSSPWLSQESLLRDVRGYFTSESSMRYEDDFFQVDDSGRTELGVSCLRRIFLDLPEMPIPDTLGCDYFQKNLLYQLSRPVMFQSRKMRHDHDAQRKQSTVSQFVDYSLRDLRYVVLWPIWSRHNENLRNAPPTFVHADGSLDTAWYASSFRQALAEKAPEAKGTAQRFAEVFQDASRQVTGEAALRLTTVEHRSWKAACEQSMHHRGHQFDLYAICCATRCAASTWPGTPTGRSPTGSMRTSAGP